MALSFLTQLANALEQSELSPAKNVDSITLQLANRTKASEEG